MNDRTRAHAEYLLFADQYGIHLMIDGAVAEPAEIVLHEQDESTVMGKPWVTLPSAAMHALYDAIGRALGKHTCNEEVLREALRIERQRTEKMLNKLVGEKP